MPPITQNTLPPVVATPLAPIKTHHSRLLHYLEVAVCTVGIILTLSIISQLVYPRSRTLPSAKFGGIDLGLKTKGDIESRLNDLNNQSFNIKVGDHNYSATLNQIGLSVDSNKVKDKITDYPASQRFVPFSFFLYEPSEIVQGGIVTDQAKLDKFAQKIASENNTKPKEGLIKYNPQTKQFDITYSQPGVSYDKEEIKKYLSSYTGDSLSGRASLPYKIEAPNNSQDYLDKLAAQTKTLTASNFSLTTPLGDYEIKNEVLEKSVRFNVDEATKKLLIDIDRLILAANLQILADQVFVQPTKSKDGQELDVTATADAIVASANEPSVKSAAVLKPLKYTGQKMYPATNKGIQSMIEDWRASHASLGSAIDFSEIGGLQRSAEVDNDKRYFSASVYKVFSMWIVLDQIDKGQLDPAGKVVGSFNLKDCFYNAIIISDSDCSEPAIYAYGGWAKADKFIKDSGVNDIYLSSGVNITAKGMTQFLQKLDAGELLSENSTKLLLDAMKTQKYRQGVPAGSAGKVANKVGYQPRRYSWHDAAIVYHPKTKYTLVILTEQGARLETLATLAKQISDTLNR